jgi:acetyl-CoA carboxylase carboxyl transferase subunit alpha
VASPSHLEFESDIVEIQGQIDKLLELADRKGIDVSEEVDVLNRKLEELTERTYRNLRPIEQVQVARHPERPYTLDYVERIFDDWIELHGDPASAASRSWSWGTRRAAT